MQAFITSVELGRQICELLPLADDCDGGGDEPCPALPLDDPATLRRCVDAQALGQQNRFERYIAATWLLCS